MDEFGQPIKKALLLFILASLLTFGFITALQFTPMPWFFLVLIAMHGGIALFVISKKHFKELDLDVAPHYKTQYVLLVPYLFVMLYTFASKAGLIPLLADEKSAMVLFYSLFCVFITIWNYLRLRRSIKQQTYESAPALANIPEWPSSRSM